MLASIPGVVVLVLQPADCKDWLEAETWDAFHIFPFFPLDLREIDYLNSIEVSEDQDRISCI